MSAPKKIVIKESLNELRKLQKNSIPMIANRLRVLIEFKKHEETGISKREVSDIVGVNHNSVQTWRSKYIFGGIDAILSYEKKEGRPSLITKQEHEKIEAKLKNPQNGLNGFVELQQWIEDELKKELKYNTVFQYAKRNFGAKVKVARKSHVKKDEQAVEDFKKTSINSVNKSGSVKKKNSKQ
jgi:transposase